MNNEEENEETARENKGQWSELSEGCGCAAVILAVGIAAFLCLASFQLTEIVKYLTTHP